MGSGLVGLGRGSMSVVGGLSGSGFGVGSALLNSIVHISHAGLSDNVRRETLLHMYSRRSAGARVVDSLHGHSSSLVTPASSQELLPADPGLEADPTLCWHCYIAILERIEDDHRLVDRNINSYREFISQFASSSATGDEERHLPGAMLDKRFHEEGDKADEKTIDEVEAIESIGSPSSQHLDSEFPEAFRLASASCAELRAELTALEQKRDVLCRGGANAWEELAGLEYEWGALGAECGNLLRASRAAAEEMADLSGQAVLRDTFVINNLNGFPVINGYRLVRVQDERKRLNWNEINAAWGQAVLLVRCICHAIGFSSHRYCLIPLNCESKVLKLGDDDGGGDGDRPGVDQDNTYLPTAAHDLFWSGGGDDDKRVNEAIAVFVACCTETLQEVELQLRVRTEEETGDKSMEGGSGGVEDWTGSRGIPPNKQSEMSLGGVAIGSLGSSAQWRSWLCQLVQNLDWGLEAASSLSLA
ncbi:unnamed protein product [Choristocarpus tenellus]